MQQSEHNDNDIECKLFLGGLSPDTNEKSVRRHFEQFGELVDVVVMRNSNTNRSRCFGFVKFATQEQCQESQDNRPHTIDGREVDVKLAVARTQEAIEASQINSQNARKRKGLNNFQRQRKNDESSAHKVYVGGIKNSIEESDLKEYFEQFGEILDVDIIKDKETGSRRGFAFLKFNDYDVVDKITIRKNHIVKGISVETQKAIPETIKGQNNYNNQPNNNRRSGGNYSNNRNNRGDGRGYGHYGNQGNRGGDRRGPYDRFDRRGRQNNYRDDYNDNFYDGGSQGNYNNFRNGPPPSHFRRNNGYRDDGPPDFYNQGPGSNHMDNWGNQQNGPPPPPPPPYFNQGYNYDPPPPPNHHQQHNGSFDGYLPPPNHHNNHHNNSGGGGGCYNNGPPPPPAQDQHQGVYGHSSSSSSAAPTPGYFPSQQPAPTSLQAYPNSEPPQAYLNNGADYKGAPVGVPPVSDGPPINTPAYESGCQSYAQSKPVDGCYTAGGDNNFNYMGQYNQHNYTGVQKPNHQNNIPISAPYSAT